MESNIIYITIAVAIVSYGLGYISVSKSLYNKLNSFLEEFAKITAIKEKRATVKMEVQHLENSVSTLNSNILKLEATKQELEQGIESPQHEKWKKEREEKQAIIKFEKKAKQEASSTGATGGIEKPDFLK